MQLNIAICEDEAQDRELLTCLLQTVLTKKNLNARIDSFACGEDFLAAHEQSPYDIAFMDIYLRGINGTDTVRRALSHRRCRFIFTTVSSEHALEAFALEAAHYLLKPLTEEAVREALERCLPAYSSIEETHFLELKTNQGNVSIPVDNIVYIEAMNKICVVHTKKNEFRSYISLNALYELLDDALFLYAQRSYVVNMQFIDAFHFDHIILSNGLQIVLSRNNRSELKKQYERFLFRLARKGDL